VAGGERCVDVWMGSKHDLDGVAFADGFAVDHGRMLYSDGAGVWLVDPARVHYSASELSGERCRA
jgi:hypothetical protein